jgi:hypothetical protein
MTDDQRPTTIFFTAKSTKVRQGFLLFLNHKGIRA